MANLLEDVTLRKGAELECYLCPYVEGEGYLRVHSPFANETGLVDVFEGV